MLLEAGKMTASILSDLTEHVKPGVTKQQINGIAYDLIHNKYGREVDREDLTGYDSSPYACVSFAHSEIAFSGEADPVPLRKGDVLGIDISLKREGWCGDSCRMCIVGEKTNAKTRLHLAVAYQAMCLGISPVRPGAKVQDIAMHVQAYVESYGFNMLRVPSGTGHSIGRLHADGWHIPFYKDPINEDRVLGKGMVITIEPFTVQAARQSTRLPNETKSAVSQDHSTCTYWEDVVAIHKDGCEVLDLRDGEDVTFHDHEPPTARSSE